MGTDEASNSSVPREGVGPRAEGRGVHTGLCSGVRCPCWQEGIVEGQRRQAEKMARFVEELERAVGSHD